MRGIAVQNTHDACYGIPGLGAVLGANELFRAIKSFLVICQDHHETIPYSIAGNLHYLSAGLFVARCRFGSFYCLIIVEPVSSVQSISRAGFQNLTPSKDRCETLTDLGIQTK